MARQHDQQCTPMSENWNDLWEAVKAFPHGRIGHEIKNCWREWWRWHRGECDEHEDLTK